MKKLLSKYCGVTILLLTVLQCIGCTSEQQLYRKTVVSRETAYRQWRSREARERQARPNISGGLSIRDCLKLALANNKTLQRIVQEKEVARGEQLKSYSAILPAVGLTADYQRLDEIGSFTIADKKITMGDLDNYSVALRVTQPLYAGGAIGARLRAGRLFSLLADQTVRAGVQDVAYAAMRSYYDVLLNQHLFGISTDAVRSAEAHLESVKQKRRGGVAADFDVLRAEVELSNFQADLIRNRNAINRAKAALIRVMGVSQDSDFVLSDELVYVIEEMTMERAVRLAYKNRPDLFNREFNIQYQEELLRIARSRYVPTISAYFDHTWSEPDPHNRMVVDWGRAWDAGVMAAIPLFDGYTREGDIVAQRARLKQAEIDLIDAEEAALYEVTTALLSIEDAREFVESQSLNLTRAKEGLRLAEVGYEQGMNTQVEVIDAQAALTTARANYYEAIYSHMVAKLALYKAAGTVTTFEISAGQDGRAEGRSAEPGQARSGAASEELREHSE